MCDKNECPSNEKKWTDADLKDAGFESRRLLHKEILTLECRICELNDEARNFNSKIYELEKELRKGSIFRLFKKRPYNPLAGR